MLRWTPWICSLAISLTLSATTINSTMQRECPEDLQGGVAGIYAMAFMGTVPFGHLAMGSAAGALGVQSTFLLMGAAMLLTTVTLGVVRKSKCARNSGPITLEKSPQALPEQPSERVTRPDAVCCIVSAKQSAAVLHVKGGNWFDDSPPIYGASKLLQPEFPPNSHERHLFSGVAAQ